MLNHYVVMGVAGCGKSTVASRLAELMQAETIEADELHGPANISKMSRGEALSDVDRWPWLERVALAMQRSKTPVIVSCSALRLAYRRYLIEKSSVEIGFIHLHADKAVIASRMSGREGHFMPMSLLDSQFATLEHLQNNETGVVVDIAQSLESVVQDAFDYVKAQK